MNTERTPFRPEDSEGDSNDVVSFGDSEKKVFRPIPPRRQEAPAPSAESPAPRLPEGILFQRSTPEKPSVEKSEDDEDEEVPSKALYGKVVIPQPKKHPLETTGGPPVEYPEMPHLVKPTHAEQLPDQEKPNGEQDLSYSKESHQDDSVNEQPKPITIDELLKDIESRWPASTAESLPPIHGAEGPAPTAIENERHDDATATSSAVKPGTAASPAYSHASATHAASHNSMPGQGVQHNPNTVPNQSPVPPAAGNGNSLTPNQPPGFNSGGTPPPRNYNSYSAAGGGAGGGYNPNAMNQWPATPNQLPEQTTTIVKKRGSVLPYVAVLAENIARKRADRRLKKELSERIDEQERRAESNQLRLEEQNRRMAEAQRRQSIREAYRPSGHEWGVPKPVPDQEQIKQMAKEVVPEVEQAIELKPQQHVEHSAWHSIVVNEHGHAVADAMQYGEGFRRERQQEVIRDHTGDAVTAGVAGSASHAGGSGRASSGASGASGFGGAVYGSGSAGSYGGSTNGMSSDPYGHRLQSGLTAPGLSSGQSAPVDPQHQLPEHAQHQSNVPGPLFWFMLSLIIIAFFVAALL